MPDSRLSPDQIRLIRQSFERVAVIADQAAALFYQRLFELDPGIRPLFGPDITAQGRKLMQAITLLVRGLDDLERITPVLRGLGARHVGYGVENGHYDRVGEALLWTLERGLGEDFDAAQAAAWTGLYGLVAGVMQQAAAEAVDEPADGAAAA